MLAGSKQLLNSKYVMRIRGVPEISEFDYYTTWLKAKDNGQVWKYMPNRSFADTDMKCLLNVNFIHLYAYSLIVLRF